MSKLALCIDPQNSCFHDLDFIWSACLCIVDVTREQGLFCFFTCPLTLLKAHCVDWRNSSMSQIMKMLSQCFVIKLCQGARFLLVSNQCISYWAHLRLDSLWLRAWCWSHGPGWKGGYGSMVGCSCRELSSQTLQWEKKQQTFLVFMISICQLWQECHKLASIFGHSLN